MKRYTTQELKTLRNELSGDLYRKLTVAEFQRVWYTMWCYFENNIYISLRETDPIIFAMAHYVLYKNPFCNKGENGMANHQCTFLLRTIKNWYDINLYKAKRYSKEREYLIKYKDKETLKLKSLFMEMQ